MPTNTNPTITTTTTTAPPLTAIPMPGGAPRPGSRLARMAMPTGRDALRQVAERQGVCVNPIVMRRVDHHTGQTEIIEVPCGARLASKCKPCAERNRRIRIEQIREGWHLDTEPEVRVAQPGEDVLALVRHRAHLEFERDDALRNARWDQLADVDKGITEVDELLAKQPLRGHLTPPDRKQAPRRTRSTKRRQDTPDLPRLPVAPRTVGRTYAGKRGQTYRPSMLVSLTLPSYGAVHTAGRWRRGGMRPCQCGALHGERDPLLGVPLEPGSYDYRRAALDAIHFARVVDRWWQNLRRAAGWAVQYAGCVELQKRLAPHAHFAVRGTIPRRLLKQVAAATYHQVWWPSFDTPVFTVDTPPVWDPDTGAYLDPRTKAALPTWEQALDAIDHDPQAAPAYVARLGSIDARGVDPGTADAERTIRYVTKYVTKDITATVTPDAGGQRAHFDRMHTELSTLPCAPTCANWLLYGVQPDGAKAGLVPGRCSGKVHQPQSLGFTGRRVLISRKWSTRTMTDVRADRAAWVRAILAESLNLDAGTDDTAGVSISGPDGPDRYSFTLAKPGEPGVAPLQHRLLRAISQRIRWRAELNAAKARRRPPDPSTRSDGVSATMIERR